MKKSFQRKDLGEKNLAREELLVAVKSVRYFSHGLQDSIVVVRSGQSFLH